jgi:hypothetical protein
MEIKFMYNGVKIDGKLYRAWYSKGNYTPQSKLCENTITIRAKDYKGFPNEIEGLKIQNHSDGMTDYFEKDKIRVAPDNKYYSAIHSAYEKAEEKLRVKHEKRLSK